MFVAYRDAVKLYGHSVEVFYIRLNSFFLIRHDFLPRRWLSQKRPGAIRKATRRDRDRALKIHARTPTCRVRVAARARKAGVGMFIEVAPVRPRRSA